MDNFSKVIITLIIMEKNQPVVMSMTMKTFDEDSVKKELVMEEERAEEASNVRDSPDSGSSR